MKKLKLLSLTLLLPILAGCSVINNAIGKIALDVVFKSDMLVNRLNFTSEDGLVPFETQPTTEAKRADLLYGFEALLIPKKLTVEQFVTIDIDFTVTFSEGAEALFFKPTIVPDTGEDAPVAIEMFGLLPFGAVTKPADETSLEEIGDFMDLDKMVALAKEPDREVVLTITGKAGNKTKSAKYYFNLTAEGFPLPGGGDVDIDEDYAFFTDVVGEEVDKTFTVSKTDIAAGPVTLPIQIAWFNLDPSSENNEADLTVTLDTSNLDDYDITLPEDVGPFDVTMMQTLIEYPVTLTLKEGKTAPSVDLDVRFSVLLTLKTAE